MRDLALWIPIILLFSCALLGAVVRMRSRDACLKRFHGSVIFARMKDGRWICGRLSVYATCLEVHLMNRLVSGRYAKRTHVLYEGNIMELERIVRASPRPGSQEHDAWREEIDRLQHPSPLERIDRHIRNLFSVLRDAFAQAIPLIFGAVKRRTFLGRVPVQDDRVNEMGKTLIDAVPYAYEPILERYRGRHVVIEKTGQPGDEQVGLLQEYTAKFLLTRDLENLQELPPHPPIPLKSDDRFDVIFPRQIHVVRHLGEPILNRVDNPEFESVPEYEMASPKKSESFLSENVIQGR
jgi:hypothetical protein